MFAACVDEEVNGIGTQAAIRDGLRADWAVIGEPTELQPIRACRGNCYFEVEIGGRAAHAGSPEKGVNAIYGAMQAIAATQRHGAELAGSRHPLLGIPTVSVGTIAGGSGVSVVPDQCNFWVDRRLLPGETGEQALADFRAALQRHMPPSNELRRQEWLRMELPPSEVDDDHPLVAALATAAADSGAPALPVGGWSAASDGGYLMRDARIPTVLFGPGSIVNQAHRADEFGSDRRSHRGRAHLPDHGGAHAGRPASQRSAVIRIAARRAHQRQIKRRPRSHAALRQERISGPHPPHQGAHGGARHRRAAGRRSRQHELSDRL